MIKFYSASFEYQDAEQIKQGRAQSTTIMYKSSSPACRCYGHCSCGNRKAVLDALAWWENRNKALPEHFTRMCCLKVYAVEPQKIDKNGYLPPDTGFHLYEWKLDFPGTPLEHLNASKLGKQ